MANRDASALKDASGANSRQMAPRLFPLCGSIELDMYKHICTNTQIHKYKNTDGPEAYSFCANLSSLICKTKKTAIEAFMSPLYLSFLYFFMKHLCQPCTFLLWIRNENFKV